MPLLTVLKGQFDNRTKGSHTCHCCYSRARNLNELRSTTEYYLLLARNILPLYNTCLSKFEIVNIYVYFSE